MLGKEIDAAVGSSGGWIEVDNVDDKVDYHDKRDEEIGKQAKDSKLDNDNQDGQTSAHLSSTELEERILK